MNCLLWGLGVVGRPSSWRTQGFSPIFHRIKVFFVNMGCMFTVITPPVAACSLDTTHDPAQPVMPLLLRRVRFNSSDGSFRRQRNGGLDLNAANDPTLICHGYYDFPL